MGRMVSATEFKAKCLKLIAQMEKDGEPLTIMRRGKPVAELKPSQPAMREKRPLFGCMKGTMTLHGDIVGSSDAEREEDWAASWDELGFPVRPSDREK